MELQLLIFLIVVVTSIWVWIDSSKLGVSSGNQLGWFLACLLFWIICFPIYLFQRKSLKRINANVSTKAESKSSDFSPTNKFDQLEKLGALREKGVLTEEEFQLQKAIVLGTQQTSSKPPQMPNAAKSNGKSLIRESGNKTTPPQLPEVETEAKRLFTQARLLSEEGKTDLAIDVLRRIINEYPSTGPASQARRALERHGQNT